MLEERDDLVVVSKPPGLAVHPGAGEDGRTLIELLADAYDSKVELHLVHRLDRPTSGVVLVAKSRAAAQALGRAWETAEKRYWAITLGRVREPRVVKTPLADEDGVARPAESRVRPIALLEALEPKASWVEVELRTGRFHQIRRHLAGEKRPVLLDDRYGDFAANRAFAAALKASGVKGFGRSDLLLHARTLSLPSVGSWTAPPPPGWAALLARAGASTDTLAAHALPAPARTGDEDAAPGEPG